MSTPPDAPAPTPDDSTWIGTGPSAAFQDAVPLRMAGRFQILALLGVGGMGSVYQARDVELDEVVALKVLRLGDGAAREAIERFRREVRLARRVAHPNVARVFDIGEDGGRYFLTMEFIPGETLTAALSKGGAMCPARTIELGVGICAGLTAIHAAGVIHRDIKPDNVMLTADRVVVMDFGIARSLVTTDAAHTGTAILGTPQYMAPEQIEHQPVDARTDVYTLGAVLFEAVTGRRAWQAPTPLASAVRRLTEPPPDPRAIGAVPDPLASVIVRCMARAPADRYASAAEVAQALSAVALSQREPAARPVLMPSALEGAGLRRVAVLPFQCAGEPIEDYVIEGIAEDIIDTLSMASGLRVCSLGVVRGVDPREDPCAVGTRLGVDAVVSGSLRRRGSRVRVSARLNSVADQFQLWARRFETDTDALIPLADDIANAIRVRLSADDAQQIERSRPTDPRALDLYLRGRHELQLFWRDHVERAIELLRESASLAPDDPAILSTYALALVRGYALAVVGADAAREAEALAWRVLAINPQQPEPRVALASLRMNQGDLSAAAREIRLAVISAPSNAEARDLLGRMLAEIGPLDEAIEHLQAAAALDPRHQHIASFRARCLALLGRWDEAMEMLSEAARSPVGNNLAWTMQARLALWRNDVGGAAALMQQVRDVDFTMREVVLSLCALTASGELDEGHVAALTMKARSMEFGVRLRAFWAQIRTEVLCAAGRFEAALSSLHDAVDAELFDVEWLERCPVLEPLRRHPEFPQMLAPVRRRADEARAILQGRA